MSITTQDIDQAYNAYSAAVNTALAKFDESLQIVESVQANPSAPDAQAQLDKAQALLDEGRGLYNSSAVPAGNDFLSLRRNADAAVQSETEDLEISRSKKSAGVMAKRDIIRAYIASAQEKITTNKQNPDSGEKADPATSPAAKIPNTVSSPQTSGSADDDSSKKADPAKNQPENNSGSGDPSPAASGQQPGGQASPQQTPSSGGQATKPGRRTYNPLSEYPQYTYNISLYMIGPKEYDAFILSKRKNISGAVLIAQSGGINSNVEKRGKGFTLDYYIDNLKITNHVNAKDTDTFTNSTDISFNIIEPYGFSFISNLKRCSDELNSVAQSTGTQDQGNPVRQFFILGIRFTGFDDTGKPISNKENAFYERFYDILLTKLTFKLDNKAAIYSITAASLAPGTAFGVKRGVWDSGGTLHGATVYEMLTDMCRQLNEQSKTLVEGKNIKPNKYSVEFQDGKTGKDPESQSKAPPLFNAQMRTTSDITKASLNAGKDKNNNTVKDDFAQPSEDYKTLTLSKGVPILQAFQIIISRSAFIEDAFKVLQTNALENSKNKEKDVNKPNADGQATVKWYHVSAECTNAAYNKELGDFTWDIKYIFEVYETPITDNPYSNLGVAYYGPHKRYKYWFTGKNTEVLSYVQTMDNLYFVTQLNALTNQNNASSATPPAPTATGKQPNAERTDTQNQQQQAKNSYINSLYDPSAYTSVTMKILGDPDFLMPTDTSSINDVYNQFYGTDGYTVNPNGGQVFVEVDFAEGQDYGFKTDDGTTYTPTHDGLMQLNDKIQFWNYPNAVKEAGVQGVSYMVWKVVSSLSSGKFEQDLTMSINTFPGYDESKDKNRSQDESGRDGTSTPSDVTSQNTPGQTGLTPDAVPGTTNTGNIVNQTSGADTTNTGSTPTVQTTNGPVVNDDGLLPNNSANVLTNYKPIEINFPPRDTGTGDGNGNVAPPRG